MDAGQRKVFHFHADANPIGGRVTAPVDELLPPHGSASLAQAGGHSSGRIGPHRIDGVLSFESAHSEVYGHKRGQDGPWTTTVSSVVEGLNILDIVRADALVTKISVSCPHSGLYSSVSFAGTHYLNLTVAGKPVFPVFDLDKFARSEARARKANQVWWEDDPDYLAAAMDHNHALVASAKTKRGELASQRSGGETETPELSWIEKRYGWMTAGQEATQRAKETQQDAEQRIKKGVVVCSLVKEINDASGPNATRLGHGHILNVPEVGHLFLGELSVSRGLFRVTLLRAELGCLADGDLSAGGASAGGMMMEMEDHGGQSGPP